MNFKSKIILFISHVLLCLSIFGQQKQVCKINLKEAAGDYQIGKFTSVETSLRDCLENGDLEYPDRIGILRLLAMNSIARDLMDLAAQDVKQLLKVNSNYIIRADDPIVLIRLIQNLRSGRGGKTVTSVSKIAESLNEAPANIIILTRDEIKERGYMDLEQVFHDLPGFDISRTSGASYSSIYQNGYRTNNNNDRSLFLIDGIEDNDIYSNKIWLTRQYPMSNIKQVDVIYGPASTMYGANAFVGVTNITTLTAEDIISLNHENFGVTGNFGRGSYNTKTADITIAFRKKKLSGTVTGRFFSSDEFDRGGFEDFDYKYTPADASAYQALTMTWDPTIASNEFIKRDTINKTATYTFLGAQRARELDSLGFATNGSNKDIAYSNKSLNKYILAKLNYGNNLTLGFQYWNRDEGLAWFNDSKFAGTDNDSRWNPVQTSYYLKYDNEIAEKWNLTNLTVYKKHELGENTGLTKFNSYFNQGRGATPDFIGNGYRDLVSEVRPEWRTTNYDLSSMQLRNELKATYQSTTFNLVSGLELRYSETQQKTSKNKETEATIPIHYSTDIGLYSQGNYTKNDIKIVLGGRLDYNVIDGDGGYGTVFNPRVAFIYSPKNWVFKSIYSEAFKDATIADKYSVLSGIRDIPNPNLAPEKVKNIEISVSWDNILMKKDGVKYHLDASAFSTNYSGFIETVDTPDGRQNQGAGALKIMGGQLNSFIEFDENIKLNFNYTYTAPYEIGENNTKIRIGDIASHKGNVILNWKFNKFKNSKKYHFNWNNRLNISGQRLTGKNTTVEGNPNDSVEPFSILNSYFSYSNKYGLTFGLGVNNVLNTLWEVPGARAATGQYASTVPQPGRNYFFNLRFDIQ